MKEVIEARIKKLKLAEELHEEGTVNINVSNS